ncbi:MAG: DUF4442 domain-containing protein [Alphaproteobacteria bacterium]|nr:DUF4442 domain-containing protein [Alphaproteobacteria bacterium]
MPRPLPAARARLGTGRLALWLLSVAVCRAAPYFSTIRPRFTRFDPGHVVAVVPKRRAVTNHLGTVHAIAMCNAAELVGGTCTDLLVPDELRWLPVGMEVEYLKLAKTTLTATCRIDDPAPFRTEGDVEVPVDVTDTAGVVVFRARIRMRVSRAKRS